MLDLPAEAEGHILAFEYGRVQSSTKLAVFDFDGTLGGPTVCMDRPDRPCPAEVWQSYREWTETFPHETRPRMQKLHAEGYKIVLMSNQNPLTRGIGRRDRMIGRDVEAADASQKQALWVSKIAEFCQLLNDGRGSRSQLEVFDLPPTEVEIPVQFFALLDGETERDRKSNSRGFNKPCASWWATFSRHFNGGNRTLDCNASFFVGDQGGRLDGDSTNPWQYGRDQWRDGSWRAVDRQFALSAGVAYRTPETVFMGKEPPSADEYHAASFDSDWCGRHAAKSWCAGP